MTKKQHWLLSRLLIPAGILPPAVKVPDLQYNEESRQKIGTLGFEYFLMVDQDVQQINHSSVKNKIYAVHAPWPDFGHEAVRSEYLRKLANLVIFTINRKITTDFIPLAEKTFKFASNVGAKVVTFHISFFNHHNLARELASLDQMQNHYRNITVAIEHDAPYLEEKVRRGKYFLRFDGSYNWMLNPEKLLSALKKLYPPKKFGICLDSASLIGQNLPLVETARRVLNSISHVHLAGSTVGDWITKDIDQGDIVEIVDLLYQRDYSGYITAEVNGTIGPSEEQQAKIYAVSSLIGLSLLKKQVVQNAQAHIENSCRYLLSHLK